LWASLWRSLNSPMDMGEEGGDGGACSLGTLNPQMPSRQSLKALAETARAFAFRARNPPRPAHRSRTGGGSVLLGQMFQYEVAGCLSLVKRLERRAADLDRATAQMKWTPRRQIAGAPVKAGAGGAVMGDHKRKAVAACAPYFQVLGGAVELQGHP